MKTGEILIRRISGMAESIALVSLVVFVAGCFGSHHFLLDLCSHFRLQATLALLVCGAVALPLAERRSLSVVSLLAGVVLLASLVPYFVPQRLPRGGVQSRLIVFNVLSENRQYDKTAEFILGKNPDIVVLLETNEAWKREMVGLLGARYPYHVFGAREDDFGVGVLSRHPLVSAKIRFFSNELLPSVDLLYRDDNVRLVRIIGVHPVPPLNHDSWLSRNRLMETVAEEVAGSSTDRVIVCGDLNCSPWSPLFNRLIRESGLRDSSRGQGIFPTWTGFTPLLGVPIDHILISEGVDCLDRSVGPSLGSDHRPLVMDFR